MTIAKYIRLSSADEAARFGEKEESNSIVNQRRLLDGYIAASPEFAGWRVLEFQDDGKSGIGLRDQSFNVIVCRDADGWIGPETGGGSGDVNIDPDWSEEPDVNMPGK